MKRFQRRNAFLCTSLSFLAFSIASLFYLAPRGKPNFHSMTQKSGDVGFTSGTPLSSFSEESTLYSKASDVIQPPFSSSYSLGVRLTPKTTDSVRGVFKDHSFHFEGIHKGRKPVPRIYLAHFPKDWRGAKLHGKRQQLFIQIVLPLILEENEYILLARKRAIDLFDALKKGKQLEESDRTWLYYMAKEYKVRPFEAKALLARLDLVPPSLALAQAILETGFGYSHAAMHKNSIFGHMKTLTQVRSYQSLRHSVVSYIHNLNIHLAYRKFHEQRFRMRERGEHPSGFILAQGLRSYSIRRENYIRDLQTLIRRYGLEWFDTAHLEPSK